MSAISNHDGTGPIPAAHRVDAPVWAFHYATAYLTWAGATVAHRLAVWEDRHATRTAVLAAVTFTGITTIAAAITGTVLV